METDEYEVVAIGAGPAGCGAARLLAAWGHRVLLLDARGPHDHALAVSIPPSARRALEALGMLSAVDAAGFHPWRGNTIWWADNPPRAESFAPGAAGYQVIRADLNRLVQQLARDAGADVRAARARSVRLPDASSDEGARSPLVQLETPAGPCEVRAEIVLDCSGRTGVIARGTLRELETSVRTVALTGIWRTTGSWGLADETHTLVASYRDGWAWSIPTADDVRYVTVMVDPQRTDLTPSESAASVYLSELAKVRGCAPLFERGSLVGGPWGHDASLYSARQYAGPGFLLVGDAGSFIDPLSSYGVKKALASAWVAAVAAHTALVKPELRSAALAFHDQRERRVYASYRRQAARFAAAVAEQSPHAFWIARAAATRTDNDPTLEAPELAGDPTIAAAFNDLRQRAAVRLRISPDVHMVHRPAICGCEIALVDHLVIPDRPDGIRYLSGVDLVTLAQVASQHTSVGEIFQACVGAQGRLNLPHFLGALAFLIARGVLLDEDAGLR
jgi:flavin-dependent dehydrogenase